MQEINCKTTSSVGLNVFTWKLPSVRKVSKKRPSWSCALIWSNWFIWTNSQVYSDIENMTILLVFTNICVYSVCMCVNIYIYAYIKWRYVNVKIYCSSTPCYTKFSIWTLTCVSMNVHFKSTFNQQQIHRSIFVNIWDRENPFIYKTILL